MQASDAVAWCFVPYPPDRRPRCLPACLRIDTIMDCDQLLVLSNGNLLEQGTPSQLSATPGSSFANMVNAGHASALKGKE